MRLGLEDTGKAKLDQIEGEVPDDVPDPDGGSPTPSASLDLGEAPVSVDGDQSGNDLGEDKGEGQDGRGTLDEGETLGAGDKDQSLGESRNLEVDNRVETVIVVSTLITVITVPLAETHVLEELGVDGNGKEGEGREGEVDTVDDSRAENLLEVPVVGVLRGDDAVLGDGQDGSVVEDSEDKNHEGREIKLPGKDHDREAEDDTDSDRAGVGRVVAHALEDLAGSEDGIDNDRQTGLGQDNVGSRAGSVRGISDSNTDVGLGKSRGIVDTITSHGSEVAEVLETGNNVVLVLRIDTSETIGLKDELIDSVGLDVLISGGTIAEDRGVEHMVTELEATTSLLGNSKLVSSNHLNLDTQSLSTVNGLLGIVAGGIVDGQETNESETSSGRVLEALGDLFNSNSKGTKTTAGKLINISVHLGNLGVGLVAGAEIEDDGRHSLGDTVDGVVGEAAVGHLGTLVGRVEGDKVELLNSLAGQGGVGEGLDNTGIDGILVLHTGGVGREEDNVLGGDIGVGLDVGEIDGQFVKSKSSGLVRAKNGNTSQLLNSRHAGNNSFVLGKLTGTNSEGDGENSGHGNGDTTNEQDKDVVDTTAVGEAEAGVHDKDLNNNEEGNRDDTEATDATENDLQVSNIITGHLDKLSSTTEESVGTGTDDNSLTLSLLDSRTREDLITVVLVRGEGLSGQGSLVDRDVDGINKAGISGDNISELDSNDITGNQGRSLESSPLAITLDLGLRGEGGHESLDGVSSLTLLNITDGGVGEQKEDDTDEIGPVGGFTSSVGKDDGNDGSSLHDPRKRVPHEGQELHDWVHGLLLQTVVAKLIFFSVS